MVGLTIQVIDRMAMEIKARPGDYVIVGRYEDSGRLIYTITNDLPENPGVRELCQRALYEMGLRDPAIYEFLTMIKAGKSGGATVALSQEALYKYINVNFDIAS